MTEKVKVAIIGAGVIGLGALKNFLEEGFDATLYEKNSYVGGLWHFTEDPNQTTATDGTLWNSCRQMSCYTDFPIPADYPDFPNVRVVQKYVESYCEHFDLYRHIKLKYVVKELKRSKDDTKWLLHVTDATGVQKVEISDKVVFATGQSGVRHMPVGIEGLEHFKGELLHGQGFKHGKIFKGKKVVILGSSNTAMDAAAEMHGSAEKIYLANRSGGSIVPRYYEGVPCEFAITARLQGLGRMINNIAPSQWTRIFNSKVLQISEATWGKVPKQLGLNNPAPGIMINPIINDHIIGYLERGDVKLVKSIRRIQPSGAVELTDGTVLSDIDTLILATGYKYDFSMITDPKLDPTRVQDPRWTAARRSGGRPLARLYQGLLSLEYPDSLAFLGIAGYPSSQVPLYDLVSMAITQIWQGKHPLPSRAVMEAEVDQRLSEMIEIVASGKPGPSILPGSMNAGKWTAWLHEAAGTGVMDRLGYGWKGWWYWLWNYRECSTLMTGVNSPHIWRLWDGRRKKWDGARDAITVVNEERTRRMKEAKQSKKKKV